MQTATEFVKESKFVLFNNSKNAIIFNITFVCTQCFPFNGITKFYNDEMYTCFPLRLPASWIVYIQYDSNTRCFNQKHSKTVGESNH